MARDYKHRAATPESKTKTPSARKPSVRKAAQAESLPTVSLWRWFLAFGIIALFTYFLYHLSLTEQKNSANLSQNLSIQQHISPPSVKQTKPATQKHKIQYDFYTILPKAEFVIPDHEIKTRKREQRIGKAKTGVKYSIQAGAFRTHKDADSLRANLLMMGFSPKIEKAVIGSATWYRVKMGPYSQLRSIDAIQSRLKSHHMEALVIEIKK